MLSAVTFWTSNSPIFAVASAQVKRIGQPGENPNGYGTCLVDFPLPQVRAQWSAALAR